MLSGRIVSKVTSSIGIAVSPEHTDLPRLR
jgi:hypothetical protein